MRSGGLLFVTEKFPFPVDDGGQIRTYHVLASLASEFPVKLISLQPPRPEHEAPIRDLGVEVVTYPRRNHVARRAWFATEAVFASRPYPINKNFSAPMLAEMRRRISSGEVRAVHLNHLDAAQYVEHLGPLREQVRAVFDSHNVLTTLYERLHDIAVNPLRRGYCGLQWMKMHRFERRVMQACDRVLVCSDVEQELLRRWGIDRTTLVPNGVDTASFADRSAAERTPGAPPTLVFTGALGYPPNAEGVRWFLDTALPHLREMLPASKVLIVGKDPPRSLLSCAKPGEIEFTGYVDDVRPYLARADVCVVPMRVGGGTRLKILEAMAAGVPVVSTRVGAEGLRVTHAHDIWLADEPREMARAIADLWQAPETARALAMRGRALVVERYDWRNVTRPLVDFYASEVKQ